MMLGEMLRYRVRAGQAHRKVMQRHVHRDVRQVDRSRLSPMPHRVVNDSVAWCGRCGLHICSGCDRRDGARRVIRWRGGIIVEERRRPLAHRRPRERVGRSARLRSMRRQRHVWRQQPLQVAMAERQSRLPKAISKPFVQTAQLIGEHGTRGRHQRAGIAVGCNGVGERP